MCGNVFIGVYICFQIYGTLKLVGLRYPRHFIRISRKAYRLLWFEVYGTFSYSDLRINRLSCYNTRKVFAYLILRYTEISVSLNWDTTWLSRALFCFEIKGSFIQFEMHRIYSYFEIQKSLTWLEIHSTFNYFEIQMTFLFYSEIQKSSKKLRHETQWW